MTPDDLRRLALAASQAGSPEGWPKIGDAPLCDDFMPEDEAFIAACSPEVILALLDVIDAAKAMRGWVSDPIVLTDSVARDVIAFDAALAALEREGK